MAKRYKRESTGGLIWAVIGILVLVVAIVFAIVYREPIKEKTKESVEVVGGWIGGTEKNDQTPVVEEGFDDVVFSRMNIRYTPNSKPEDGLAIMGEYTMSNSCWDTLAKEGKQVAGFFIKADEYNIYYEDGMTHAETMNALFEGRADSKGLTLDEYKLWLHNNVHFNSTVDRNVDEFGNLNTVLRFYLPVSYENLNTRYLLVPVLFGESGDTFELEYAILGGKKFNDLAVSLAYLSSTYLNQQVSYEQPYNSEVFELCQTTLRKACAQASGLAESEWETITETDLQLTYKEDLSYLHLSKGDIVNIPGCIDFKYDIDYAVFYPGFSSDTHKVTADGVLTVTAEEGEFIYQFYAFGNMHMVRIIVE